MAGDAITIEEASADAHFAALRELVIEYADRLEVDLAYQGFGKELQELQERYGRPGGFSLLACDPAGYCGCVAVRRFDRTACEMKRLYVRDRVRHAGVGRLLAQNAVTLARECGYRVLLLDTLPTMIHAIRLYESLGFDRVPPYYDSPIEGTVYLALRLD